MRVLALVNNWIGWQVLKRLKRDGDELVGLVIHPPERSEYRDEILRTAALPPSSIFDGSTLRKAEVLAAIRHTRADIGISALFGYILRPEFVNLLPLECVNLHPSMLPYNRGAHPNVWSIIEDTPAGVTMHYIDAGVDTGDVIAQQEIPIEPHDTGDTLYHKLEQAAVALFETTWPLIRIGTAARIPQARNAGTHHRVRDIDRIDEIHLDRAYNARDLINILRARTFAPYQGTYFRSNGRKVYLQLRLLSEEES